MKKILSGIIAVSVALCTAASVFAAPKYTSKGSITVKSNSSSASDTKKASLEGSAELDISQVLKWKTVEKNRAVKKTFEITSEAGRVEEGTTHPYIPVDMRLRIVNGKVKTENKYVAGAADASSATDNGKVSVFEYFTLTVSNDKGVIFTADDIPSDASEIEIPLSLFNCSDRDASSSKNYSDKKEYTVSLRENTAINKDDVAEYAYPTSWDWYVDAVQLPSLVDGTPAATPVASVLPDSSSAPELPNTYATLKPLVSDNGMERKDMSLKAGDYIVGKDIAPGKYYVVGSGMLRSYDADGSLTGNVDLATAVSANGYYPANLPEGSSISLSENADFKTTMPVLASAAPEERVRATATPRVRSTVRPRVTATPRATATPKPTSTPTARPAASPKATAASKTNPKTGDTAPIVGLSAIGILSLCAIFVIQMKKKNS